MSPNMQHAVAEAVTLVNQHAGRTCVRLWFAGDLDEIDFVANSAKLQEGAFEFNAGFETYRGQVDELSKIDAQLIQ